MKGRGEEGPGMMIWKENARVAMCFVGNTLKLLPEGIYHSTPPINGLICFLLEYRCSRRKRLSK